MRLAKNYAWEAETANGTTTSNGGDLSGCVRVSFIPQRPGLVRHDIIGLNFQRRFGRGFVRLMNVQPDEYVHCVVTDVCRLYLRCSDGTVLITPPDYELYL